jgi:hypothetical protein
MEPPLFLEVSTTQGPELHPGPAYTTEACAAPGGIYTTRA